MATDDPTAADAKPGATAATGDAATTSDPPATSEADAAAVTTSSASSADVASSKSTASSDATDAAKAPSSKSTAVSADADGAAKATASKASTAVSADADDAAEAPSSKSTAASADAVDAAKAPSSKASTADAADAADADGAAKATDSKSKTSGKADKAVRASDEESGKADQAVRASDKALKEAPDTTEGLAAKLNRKKWMVFIIVGLLSLVADQATKIWARSSLPTDRIHASLDPSVAQVPCAIPDDIVSRVCKGHEVGVIGKFWSWRLSMNPGSAFGLFSGQNSARIFLSIVGIAAVFGMVWMLRKARTDQRVLHWALALVAGGAIGNLIDRIYYGVVTDFVLWKYKTTEWPVFNVADVVLVVGVGLMFIDIQKEGRREKRERAEKVKAAGLVKRR